MLPTPLRIRKRAAETGQIHLWGARAVHQELIRTLHTPAATIHRLRTRRSREGPNEFVITGIVKPPLTLRIWPLIHDDSGDAKKSTALAMSAGSPIRPSG